MKKTVGIFAHVDAGKTTLSERLLFKTKAIRKAGRVDDKNTTMDYGETERRRGITVFSDVATFTLGENTYYLVDTPGHTDFSPQAERALGVIDYGILVISASDGIQAHTKTLWGLLERLGKPVIIFVNKADMPTAEFSACLTELRETFGECISFMTDSSEELALCDESLLESYTNMPGDLRFHPMVRVLIKNRQVFPCFYGSALTDEGMDFFLEALDKLTETDYDETGEFSARVFKVRHTEDGNRVCFLKILSGSLRVKDKFQLQNETEKVNEIRFYTGAKYQPSQLATAGDVCGVCGLLGARVGDVIGGDAVQNDFLLQPAMACAVYCSPEVPHREVLAALRVLEDEEPTLSVYWNEELQDLQIHIMGPIQQEILADELKNRFGIEVTFGECKIMYRETICRPVYGFGHFEPLRHYAEVHLKLSPLPPGSGIHFSSEVSGDVLPYAYQHLVKAHVFEKKHIGVLTGSPITDVAITLMNGKAHEKHTAGGDFREATYRAIRQGLFSAESTLLEPVYAFEIHVPQPLCGKVIADVQRMYGECETPRMTASGTKISGVVPVATALDYPARLAAETGGEAQISLRVSGYMPCHNSAAVIEKIGYQRERDTDNPAHSVFVSHGAAYTVPWNEMENAIHLEKPEPI